MIFKKKNTIEVPTCEYFELLNCEAKYKELLKAKDAEIAFYEKRGDHYMNNLENRQQSLQELFKIAEKLLLAQVKAEK